MTKTYQAKNFTGEQLDGFMEKVLDQSFAGRGLAMDPDGTMHCVAPNYWRLVHTYTHTRNREVYPESVDLATGVFTAEKHGLVSGQMVFVVVHEPYHMQAPYNYLPGGLIIGSQTGLRVLTRYSVTVVDENSFKLTVVGKTEPLTYTEVSTMDLSKFHFEVWTTAEVVISDLPEVTEALVLIKGRIASSYKYVLPNGHINYAGKQAFANYDDHAGSASSNGDSSIGYRSGWGGLYTKIELKFIGNGHLLQFKEEDTHCFSQENVAYAYHSRTYSHRSMESNTFNQITFTDGGCFFNGSTIEVYLK